jgi:2-polyprenyl-6-methoxyphenol hydroxylase-like FAD-dependent oxidoreductase
MTVLGRKQIFIAGAGPVGLAAAIELTRRGFPLRIIDKAPAAALQSRALLVNARTLDLMAPSGAIEALLAAGHRIRKLVIRRGPRVISSIDLTHSPSL